MSAAFVPLTLAFQPVRVLPSKIGVILLILSNVACDAGVGGGNVGSALVAATAAGGVAAGCANRLVESAATRVIAKGNFRKGRANLLVGHAARQGGAAFLEITFGNPNHAAPMFVFIFEGFQRRMNFHAST